MTLPALFISGIPYAESFLKVVNLVVPSLLD
jgi:hypothetical protein